MATKAKFYTELGAHNAGDLQVDGNTVITGNLTVNGSSVTIESTTTSVADSMIELAKGNTQSDTIDIGIYGNYDDGLSDGGASEYTGLFRDATDSTWKLFEGLEAEPTSTVNLGGTGYTLADLQVGDLTATTLTATNSLTGASISYPTSDGSNGQVLTTNGSGTLTFEDAGSVATETVTTTSTSATNLSTFAIASFRSGHYQVQISDATGTAYQSTELLVLHNGTTPSISQYGTVVTGSELATFAVDVDSGSLRVRITPASTNSTVFKFKKTLIVV